jgi:hypothetical protein
MQTKMKIVTDYEELLRHLTTRKPDLLLLNLDSLEGSLNRLEECIRAGPCKTVGYYSHTNSQLAAEAKRVGIDAVSRGAFVAKLPDVLREVAKNR